ncbi:DNA repair protein RadC [Desulfovibrio sp. OttesenSCG-928-A18]|nr:DNA repair protein RadC [Desulfovibrio sp. OttesenSCG-928-A18]
MAHFHGHRARLRQRFKEAPESIRDYELLELLLGHVLLRRDTKPMAKLLLQRYKDLRGVLEARPEDYKDIEGLGEGVAAFFALLKELLLRYLESPFHGRRELCGPEQVAEFARERLGSLTHEEVWTAYLDNGNRLLAWEKAARGGLDRALVSPRDILERALRHKAAAFILVHNHPGGKASPSGADLNLTEQIERAARLHFIRFVDHVIVSDTQCYSMMRDCLL